MPAGSNSDVVKTKSIGLGNFKMTLSRLRFLEKPLVTCSEEYYK